jgi:hypothetical protein
MSEDSGDKKPPADDFAARNAELERKLAEMEATAHERIVRAELKAEALRAGMVDLDGLKLLDTARVKLGENGEVEGAQALMRDLKRAKPWLFGGASSSSTAGAPPAQPPKPRLATEMNFDEWQKARAELLKRR